MPTTPVPFTLIIVFISGLCFGSFLNVIVYRLPRRQSLAQPPSSCPGCRSRLSAIDLIPLFGFFLLRGRCRYCGVSISIRYPVIELLCGLLFLACACRFGITLEALFYLTLLYIMLAIALIDYEHRIIPNSLVAAGLAAALLLQAPMLLAYRFTVSDALLSGRTLSDSFYGFLAGGTLMLIVFLVSRGGMGAGDVKLMGMIGFYVGLGGTFLVMLFGFLFGALVGVAGMISGRLSRKDALPFAPYLAFATLVQVFWGEQIWLWYLNLLG